MIGFCVCFLAFDFWRFCLVIRFFLPRHNGQWPPTSKDFYTRFYPLHYFLILIFDVISCTNTCRRHRFNSSIQCNCVVKGWCFTGLRGSICMPRVYAYDSYTTWIPGFLVSPVIYTMLDILNWYKITLIKRYLDLADLNSHILEINRTPLLVWCLCSNSWGQIEKQQHVDQLQTTTVLYP